VDLQNPYCNFIGYQAMMHTLLQARLSSVHITSEEISRFDNASLKIRCVPIEDSIISLITYAPASSDSIFCFSDHLMDIHIRVPF
jgi:hypothetical protein